MIEEKYLRAVGILIRDSIRNRIKSGKVTPKTNKSGTTLVGSGRLANSISYQISNKTIVVGTNLKYARIQHEGGLIKPKKAQYLAIPLSKDAKVKRPREFENTFIQKGIIFQDMGNGKIRPIYKLQKQVEIPARPYMFIDDNTQSRIVAIIGEAVKVRIKNGLQASN